EGTLATEDADYSLQAGGGFLFVHGTAGGITRVRELLRGLQDALVQNVSISHRAKLLPDTRQADATLHELLVPSLVGREVCVHRLFETNILANVHVEVAQEAGSLEPRVELLQSGTWLRARAVPVDQRLHLDLDVQSALAPMPQMRTVMPDGGVLMQERIASCRVSHDGVIAVGEVVAHGDGPGLHVAGALTRTQMTTTVRR
ncbi:MAG: hypothetical protein KAI24_22050, partial [Planctomycetes bacterium]|nr:hypothetical protein [Planctomycetota bacterium]